MSVMSNIALMIEDACMDGLDDAEIAAKLNIPVQMVTDYLGEGCDPEWEEIFNRAYDEAKERVYG